MSDCEAMVFKHGAHDALCDAADGAQKSFMVAPEVVDRRLS